MVPSLLGLLVENQILIILFKLKRKITKLLTELSKLKICLNLKSDPSVRSLRSNSIVNKPQRKRDLEKRSCLSLL